MKYALENIESLMQLELQADSAIFKQPATESLSLYILKITEEKKLVRSYLMEEAYNLSDEKSVQLLIHRYQSALINLTDEIIQSVNRIYDIHTSLPHKASSMISIYHRTLTCLEELLLFIEKNFNKHFNFDERLPENYKSTMQIKFAGSVQGLFSRYKILNLHEALLDILLQPFQNFIVEESSVQVSYRQLQYLTMLHKELSELVLPEQRDIAEKKIVDLLFYLNFNEEVFLDYYKSIISKQMNDDMDLSLQVEHFAWWIKTISQARINLEASYKPRQASAKDHLLSWLKDEMTFLEKKYQLNLIRAPLPNSPDQTPLVISTTLSVKQLALFTRLIYDAGMIVVNNQTGLLSKIAATFKTPKAERISPQNFRVKYYNIDEPTKVILKELLFQMIRQLQNY